MNWWGDAKDENFSSLSQGASGAGGRNDKFEPLSGLLNANNYSSDKPYYFTAKATGKNLHSCLIRSLFFRSPHLRGICSERTRLDSDKRFFAS